METRFNFKSLDEKEASLTEQGVALSFTDTSVELLGTLLLKGLGQDFTRSKKKQSEGCT